jgi:hypothetical protein
MTSQITVPPDAMLSSIVASFGVLVLAIVYIRDRNR